MGFWDDVGNTLDHINPFGTETVGTSDFDPAKYRYDPNATAFQVNDQPYVQQLGQALSSVGGRRGPVIDQLPANAIRSRQLGALSGLEAQANGTAPSAAQIQLKQGLDAQIGAQRAQAASQRGISAGMAARLAGQGIAGAQQATNQQAAVLRAQEQTQAQQALVGALGGMRGQDLGVATNQAGLTLQAQGQNDATTQGLLQMGFGSEQQRAQMAADLERLRAQQRDNEAQRAMEIATGNVNRRQGSRNAILGAVAGGAAAAVGAPSGGG